MPFADVIGQEKPLTLLRGLLSSNRLHHALLFTGPEGVGKRTSAIMVALALHCRESQGDSCGECIECKRILSRNHPDVRQIELLPGKKEISINQVRALERDLRLRSFSGRRKVAILDPVTSLNQASQNALLKTLEEPPQDSLLILIGTSAGSLLPTLRSRCLRVEFTPLSRSLIVEFLITKKSYDRDKAALAAALCMGSLGAAIAMDREVEDRRREWARRLSDLCRGDYAAALDLAEQLSANRDETLDFLRWAQSWYRDLLLHHLGEGDLINGDLLPELQRAGAAANLERILACAVEAAHAIPKIQRNLNRRMILEHLLFGAVTSE